MQLVIAKTDGSNNDKGDIVEIRASDTPFGGHERSVFVVVQIPEPMSALQAYKTPWASSISYAIQSSDIPNDVHVLRVSNNITNSNNIGALELKDVQQYTENWGITIVGTGLNSIDISCPIGAMLQSKEFWNYETLGVIFDDSYNDVSGIHTLTVDYSARSINPTGIEHRAVERGANILSHSNKVLVAEFTRADVRDQFFNSVKRFVNTNQIKTSRYYIAPAVVDFIIGEGGYYETDLTTALSYINDKQAD